IVRIGAAGRDASRDHRAMGAIAGGDMARAAADQRADDAQPDLAARHGADVARIDAEITRGDAFEPREMLGLGQSPPVERHVRGARPGLRVDAGRQVDPVAVAEPALRGVEAAAVPGPRIAHATVTSAAASSRLSPISIPAPWPSPEMPPIRRSSHQPQKRKTSGASSSDGETHAAATRATLQIRKSTGRTA